MEEQSHLVIMRRGRTRKKKKGIIRMSGKEESAAGK